MQAAMTTEVKNHAQKKLRMKLFVVKFGYERKPVQMEPVELIGSEDIKTNQQDSHNVMLLLDTGLKRTAWGNQDHRPRCDGVRFAIYVQDEFPFMNIP